jgi:hypothetical protein
MISVALPIYNSKHIAWIALEGLCNQKTTVEWELLIAEEELNCFGLDRIKGYVDRLVDAGCVSLKYYALDYKRPLPQKWKYLAEKINKNSIGYLLQAADDYSEPNRIQSSYDWIKKGFDLVQNKYGYFYNIQTGQAMEYDWNLYHYPTGLNMAYNSKILDRLPSNEYLDRGIDRWFYQSVRPKRVKWIDNSVVGGCYTDGLNNISLGRKKNYNNPTAPFKVSKLAIEQVLPKQIITQLHDVSIAVF